MKNDTPITITLTHIDLCDLALACTIIYHNSGAKKWKRLHDALAKAREEFDAQQPPEAPQEAPAAEAE